MKTVVEAFFVQILDERVRWYCKNLTVDEGTHDAQPLSTTAHPQTPDQAVHALVQCCQGAEANCPHHYLSHSTSWRFEPPDTVVLSYIVYPWAHVHDHASNQQGHEDAAHEPPVWQELHLHDLQLAHSHAPDAPGPPLIEAHHVLSHALRHLALLTHGPAADTTVSNHLNLQAKRFLAGVIPALAGQLKNSGALVHHA